MSLFHKTLIIFFVFCISGCAPASRDALLQVTNESAQHVYIGSSRELHSKLVAFSQCMKNEERRMNIAGGIIGGGLWGGVGAASAPSDLYVIEESFSEITQIGEVYYLAKPGDKTYYRFGFSHKVLNNQVIWKAYSGGGFFSNMDSKAKNFFVNGTC